MPQPSGPTALVCRASWSKSSGTASADGDALEFYPTPPPSDAEVARLLSGIRVRILQLLARRGLAPDVDVTPTDPVAEEFPALARLSSSAAHRCRGG